MLFLPKGKYQIESKVYSITNSILITKVPKELFVKEKNYYDTEMKSLNSIDKFLMTMDQLQVINYYFRKMAAYDFNNVISLFDDEIRSKGILYVAYKLNNRGSLRLASSKNITTGIIQYSDNYSDSVYAQNIIYHPIEIVN